MSASAPLQDLPDVYPGPPVPFLWKRLVDVKLANPGITGVQLGKILGVNQQTIYMIQKREAFQRYENWVISKAEPIQSSLTVELERRDALAHLRGNVEGYLDEMQERLMHILETTESEKLQVEIIQDTYDRIGFVSKKDTAARVTPIVMTGEAMREFMNRAAEAGLTPQRAALHDVTVQAIEEKAS